jgi:glycosyltransferase involved in cell wall biosynthesis
MARLLSSLKRRLNPPSGETTRMAELTPDSKPVGRVLLSYATRVWEELLAGKGIHNRHPAAWHNFQTARTFLDLGFAVDVVWYNNARLRPSREYDAVYDVGHALERLSARVSPNTLRIYSPDFAHWTAQNSRTLARVSALRERRGIVLDPGRIVPMQRSAESAQRMLFRGGPWSQKTYAHVEAPIHLLPQFTGQLLASAPERREDVRHRFIWLSGGGMVHKGLDLVLDAFARNPQLELDVFGNVEGEQRFFEAYRHELTELPNIRLRGFVDTAGSDFAEAVSRAVAIVHPSCCEVTCTAVIAGMAGGLIPIATASTDIELDGLGVEVRDDTVEAVEAALLTASSMPTPELAAMSEAAREAAMTRYGRERFLDGLRSTLSELLGVERAPVWDEPESLRVPEIRIVQAPT